MRLTECKKCKITFTNVNEDKTNVICPNCNIQYCNKNDTERFLFMTQDLYIDKQFDKNKFISKIYETLNEYTRSLILKDFRHRLHEAEDLDYYTCQAVHYFLIYFLEDDNFIVQMSFSGLMYHKIREVMGEKVNLPSAELTLNFVFEDDTEVEYEDIKKDFHTQIEEYEDKLTLFKYVKSLIFAVEDLCNDKRENFIRLQSIHHYLKYGEKRVDYLFKNYGRYGKIKYEETLELLHTELKRLWKQN